MLKVRRPQDEPDPFLSADAVDRVYGAWSADPRKVAWAQDRYPQIPSERGLRSVAQAMWESAIPIIGHYRARPRQMRRIRRRWIDTLSQQPFARWRDDAECHHAARPFTWESEKDMAARESRRMTRVSEAVSGRL
jgi:hypothetical protein